MSVNRIVAVLAGVCVLLMWPRYAVAPFETMRLPLARYPTYIILVGDDVKFVPGSLMVRVPELFALFPIYV